MKAAATLNINNGNPHENKLQSAGREKKEKKVQFHESIACLYVPWRQSCPVFTAFSCKWTNHYPKIEITSLYGSEVKCFGNTRLEASMSG